MASLKEIRERHESPHWFATSGTDAHADRAALLELVDECRELLEALPDYRAHMVKAMAYGNSAAEREADGYETAARALLSRLEG